jgi:ComF family protein
MIALTLDKLLSIIAPHQCVGCGAENTLLCSGCTVRLLPSRPCCYHCQQNTGQDWLTCTNCKPDSALHRVKAATRYNQPAVKKLLWKLKFDRCQAAAEDIARALAAHVPDTGKYLLVPAPTASVRARQRGYDQACLIAKALTRQFPEWFQYAPVLVRIGTQRQLGNSRQQRLEQLTGAFRVTGKLQTGLPILLVDDVITTGATLQAAAATLKSAGVLRVDALVFAQA